MHLTLRTVNIDGEAGLDVAELNPRATVNDLVQALQIATDDPAVFKPLHRDRYARCAGCVYNCCKSNDIPLDLVAAESIASSLGLSLARFAQSYLRLDNSVSFPEFRKRPCPFLKQNLCTVYEARALICRLYLCTPMSERLEALRCAVLLMGEIALRQRLLDLSLGPKTWAEDYLLRSLISEQRAGLLDEKSYLLERKWLDIRIYNNPYLLGGTHETVRLRDCCTEELWDELSAELV